MRKLWPIHFLGTLSDLRLYTMPMPFCSEHPNRPLSYISPHCLWCWQFPFLSDRLHLPMQDLSSPPNYPHGYTLCYCRFCYQQTGAQQHHILHSSNQNERLYHSDSNALRNPSLVLHQMHSVWSLPSHCPPYSFHGIHLATHHTRKY